MIIKHVKVDWYQEVFGMIFLSVWHFSVKISCNIFTFHLQNKPHFYFFLENMTSAFLCGFFV